MVVSLEVLMSTSLSVEHMQSFIYTLQLDVARMKGFPSPPSAGVWVQIPTGALVPCDLAADLKCILLQLMLGFWSLVFKQTAFAELASQ